VICGFTEVSESQRGGKVSLPIPCRSTSVTLMASEPSLACSRSLWLAPSLPTFPYRRPLGRSSILSCRTSFPKFKRLALVPSHATLASCLFKPRTSTTIGLQSPSSPWPQHTPRLSFLAPQHLPEPLALLVTPPFEEASDQVCLPDRKSRTQGLATLAAASARSP
jgi:hypothetical protein